MPASESFPLILASSSPRRRELLTSARYDFELLPPHESAECGICSRETPPEMVARLALQKAADVARRVERGIVLGCDTVAECGGQILGKPINVDHAREMLLRMSGRKHRVYSGICLWVRPTEEKHIQVDVTVLRMDELKSDELEAYLQTDGWEGKAGAFGYQDGLDWVHIMEGSESNVVGLPMELLAQMFQKLSCPAPQPRE